MPYRDRFDLPTDPSHFPGQLEVELDRSYISNKRDPVIVARHVNNLEIPLAKFGGDACTLVATYINGARHSFTARATTEGYQLSLAEPAKPHGRTASGPKVVAPKWTDLQGLGETYFFHKCF